MQCSLRPIIADTSLRSGRVLRAANLGGFQANQVAPAGGLLFPLADVGFHWPFTEHRLSERDPSADSV